MSDKKKPAEASAEESQAKELDDDQLENVAGGLGDAGDSFPTESITFNYSKLEIKYMPATGDGDLSADVPGRYPVAPKKK